MGLEPTTLRLRVSCSTDWASRAAYSLFLNIWTRFCLVIRLVAKRNLQLVASKGDLHCRLSLSHIGKSNYERANWRKTRNGAGDMFFGRSEISDPELSDRETSERSLPLLWYPAWITCTIGQLTEWRLTEHGGFELCTGWTDMLQSINDKSHVEPGSKKQDVDSC